MQIKSCAALEYNFLHPNLRQGSFFFFYSHCLTMASYLNTTETKTKPNKNTTFQSQHQRAGGAAAAA